MAYEELTVFSAPFFLCYSLCYGTICIRIESERQKKTSIYNREKQLELESLNNKATKFRERQLMVKFGIAPWRKLIEISMYGNIPCMFT